MRRYFVFFLLLPCLVIGCAVPIRNEQVVTTKVVSNFNEFTKVYTYWGPSVDRKGMLDGGSWATYLQASRHENSSHFNFNFFIRDLYDGEARFYNSAYDINGNSLRLKNEDMKIFGCRSLYSCSYWEDVRIPISLEYLREHEAKGIKLQLRGSGGSTIVELPGIYIRGFLAALPNLQQQKIGK